MSKVARELQDIHGFHAFDRNDLEQTLVKSDKDLFISFRDKKITYDQLQARVAERTGAATYVVFDDIKDQLAPSILEGLDTYGETMKLLYKGKKKLTIQDLLRPLEPWEVNHRCLKSIQYHHNQKKTEREKIRE